jgi:hypothetical protein
MIRSHHDRIILDGTRSKDGYIEDDISIVQLDGDSKGYVEDVLELLNDKPQSTQAYFGIAWPSHRTSLKYTTSADDQDLTSTPPDLDRNMR